MTPSQTAASAITPEQARKLARLVFGAVAMLIPGAAWVKFIIVILDALGMLAAYREDVSAALSSLERQPFGSVSTEAREVFGVGGTR